MKISQARNFKNAFLVLFLISTLLVKTATSAVVGSNLPVKGISNVSQTSIESATNQGLGAFEPAERSVLANDRDTAVSLSPLAMLAPSPKLSAVFPLVGLIAAIIVTQLLRRRRIAQLRSSSSTSQ